MRGLGGGVFKSTNGGGNWSAVNTGLTSTSNVSALAIDPDDAGHPLCGDRISDGGVFKSTNGGGNWSAVNTGLTATSVSALAIDPKTPATLYAGTYNGGVFKSTNGGGNWSAVNTGLTDTTVQRPGDRPGDAGHPLCGDTRRRRRVQEHERRRELGRGQHRPDRYLDLCPGD